MSSLQLVADDKKYCEATKEASYPGREISRTALIWNLILATATFSSTVGMFDPCLLVILWGGFQFFLCLLNFTPLRVKEYLFGGHLGRAPPLPFTCPSGGG